MVHFTVYTLYKTENWELPYDLFILHKNTLRKQQYSITGNWPRSTLCILFNSNAIIKQSCHRTRILNTKNDIEMLTYHINVYII